MRSGFIEQQTAHVQNKQAISLFAWDDMSFPDEYQTRTSLPRLRTPKPLPAGIGAWD